MVDREKVLNGLRACADRTGALCRTCPYDFRKEGCISDMAEDALELLKEQQETIISLQHIINKLNEAIAEHPKRKRGHWGLDCSVKPAIYVCSTCRFKAKEMSKYCPNCGMRTEEAL